MSKNNAAIMKDVITVERAKKELPKLIKEIKESKKRYLLSLKGKPQVVVMGFDDYLRSILRVRRSKTVTRIQEKAKAEGLDKLTLKDINYEIMDYRKERK